MAEDGYISDESDFYGSSRTRAALELQAQRELDPPKMNQFARLVNVKRARTEAEEPQSSHRTALANVHTQLPTAPSQEEEAYDFDVSHPSAWNPHLESILEFLNRAPVGDSATAALGPWLWVHNPKFSRSNESPADVPRLTDAGQGLLKRYRQQKGKLEAGLAGKTEATITRRLKPYREELQKDILRTAVDTNVTCGKWLLFPKIDAVPKTWRLVAEATAAGRLGPTCKVATAEDNGKDVSLICVYTYDFTDTADVKRVLEALVDVGLVSRDGSSIYYKCDAYTYLNITSGNEYKLKASMYASKDLLKDNASISTAANQGRPPTSKDSFFATLSL